MARMDVAVCSLSYDLLDDTGARSRVETPGMNKRMARAAHLKRTYNISVEDYDRMFLLQGKVCAICAKTPARGTRLHVDHDHVTGHVRGLLCLSCNLKLGWYEMYGVNVKSYLRMAKVGGVPCGT